MEIEAYTIPRVIGIKQAAAEFGISEYTLRLWIKTGRLPVVLCGRKQLINCTTLSKFLVGEVNETEKPEPVQPVAVGADGTLYAKSSSGKTAKNGNGKLYKVMPPIK